MKRLLAMLVFVAMGLVSAAAFALPSVTDVQAEVQKGNYAQAETLMRDVVAAKPGSAKAHYVYAEILAHNKRYEFALQEARLAKQLDPAIGFTQPDKFKSFEQLLEREQRGATAGGNATGGNTAGTAMQAPRAVEQRSGGIPGWIWGAGFAVIAVLLWRMFSARRAQTMSAPAYAGMPTGGYGPNYSPMGGGTGSGMLGTGLACWPRRCSTATATAARRRPAMRPTAASPPATSTTAQPMSCRTARSTSVRVAIGTAAAVGVAPMAGAATVGEAVARMPIRVGRARAVPDWHPGYLNA